MGKLERQMGVLLTQDQYDQLEPLRAKLGLRSAGAVVRRLVEYGLYQDGDDQLVASLALMDARKRHRF